MNTNLFLKLTRRIETNFLGFEVQRTRPAVVCKDGFSVSIQAGECLYCSPRDNRAKEYECVELGFPSEKEELIMDYAEDCDKPTDTVYGFVPVEIVDEMLEKHGGIVDIRE